MKEEPAPLMTTAHRTSHIAHRTSLIYDPPNGRRPPLNEARRLRREARSQMLFESAGAEGRSTVDRCLIGFVAGPPIVSRGYNNNMQIVQT